MSTEEIVKEILEQHLGQYKAFHLFLLLGFILIQGLFVYYITKRLERFKSFLKKSEIKFSRYHELQVESLKLNYEKLAYFSGANTDLFTSDYNTNSHMEYRARIDQWLKSYNICITQLAIDKILLPEELVKQVNITISDFQKVFRILQQEDENLEYAEMYGGRSMTSLYEYKEEELSVINSKISKLKEEDFVKQSDRNIRSLRIAIEKHFAKMNQ